MAVVRDIVNDALRELGVVAQGEVADIDDYNSCFDGLNRLVDQYKAERLMIYTITRTTWSIVSGTQDYTVGTGGTVNVARPIYLDHVNYIDTSTSPDTEYPLDTLTDDGWAAITFKALTNTIPTGWYYNPTYPLGTLSFYPVPTSSTLQGALYAPAAVDEFTSLTQSISLPPGYRRMLVKNLAVEMAPSYEREVSQVLYSQAADSKAVVKRSNLRMSDMSIDLGALSSSSRRRGYNILTDR